MLELERARSYSVCELVLVDKAALDVRVRVRVNGARVDRSTCGSSSSHRALIHWPRIRRPATSSYGRPGCAGV